jgi:ceramide glucosyltransferase
MLSAIIGGLTVLSAGINIWQWIAAGRFPLHRKMGKKSFTPAVTLFKPLKGADDETPVCLESWFAQDYAGEAQILFGVADANDPVCGIIRDLIRLYPNREAELVICQPLLGPNAKVSTLSHLQPKAKHDFWVVSDADVFAPENLLSEIAAKFENHETALVNCFYKLPPPQTFGGLWEAIAVNADFWSQVCQSNSMKPMNFALGAVMAVRKSALEKIGGFQSLLNQLADDYQLGRRIYKNGGEITLSNLVVECKETPRSFSEVWKHQLRWARTIRVCQPGPYFGSILSNTTIFALGWFAVAGNTLGFRVCVLIRILTALHNHFRLTQRADRMIEAIFTPIKDILSFAIWILAFTGSTVVWRGETFRVKRGGELQKL